MAKEPAQRRISRRRRGVRNPGAADINRVLRKVPIFITSSATHRRKPSLGRLECGTVKETSNARTVQDVDF